MNGNYFEVSYEWVDHDLELLVKELKQILQLKV